jgi:hypothetical protein
MAPRKSNTSANPKAAAKVLRDLEKLFPLQAWALLEAFRIKNREETKFPEWRERQIRKLGLSLIASAGDLARGYDEERITVVAWSTRNLLELSIWIDYCNLSEAHAKVFDDDATRDLFGLSTAVKRAAEIALRAPIEELDDSLAKFATFAKSKGIAELKDDFKSVKIAARELGREDEFKALNKLLSKLAHPTAWAVHVVDLDNLNRGYLTMILQDGVFLAMNGIIRLRRAIREKYPEVAKSRKD